MAQRNPMNERYTTDDAKGKTRKSAAAVKPKAKAASSVRIQSVAKTPKEKKQAARERQKKEEVKKSQVYKVPTPEYTFWRRVWWGCLAFGVAALGSSFLVLSFFPVGEIAQNIIMGLAYVGVIAAILVDQVKLKKIRKKYNEELDSQNSKLSRAQEKKQHAEKVAARKAAEEEQQNPEVKKKWSLSNIPLLKWFFTTPENNKDAR
jgi:hypothetical protein